MIRCRICDREHEPGAKTCACGADLAVDGIAVGVDPRFGDTDLDGALPALGDLPDLDAGPTAFPGDSSLTDSLSIPDADETPSFSEPDSPPMVADSSEVATAPKPAPKPPVRRDFAVKPTPGSGEPRRGEVPSSAEVAETPTVIAPVPTAPVVDGDLANSVFAESAVHADGSGEWQGAGDVRESLRAERTGGIVTCPTCGRDVAGDRRFCRCGHQFDVPVRTPLEPENEPSRPSSIWRRISGTGKSEQGDGRSWGQRAKDQGARRGMRYATRISGRTRFGRMGMMLAGGAGLILVLGPLRQQVRDLPNLFEASQPQQIDRWTPGPCDTPALDVPGNPWQTEFPAEGGTSDESECPGVLDTISGSFSRPVDIDRMTIEIGDTSGQSEFNRRQPVLSPSVVIVEFTHEEGEPTVHELELQDTAALQEFATKSREVTGFTLRIVDVHSHTWQELELVQIAQIAFFAD